MIDKNTENILLETSERLKEANISFYKIAAIIKEPQSTVQNIFKAHNKYSDDRVKSIIDKINAHLDDPNPDIDYLETDSPDLFIKLYALGLDSKAFTPDEKYKLAVAYKKLTDSKTKK